MSALAAADPRNAQIVAALNRDPISPELVLVDPELARAERTRLNELARLEALVDIATLRQIGAAQEACTPDAERLELAGWKLPIRRTAWLIGAFGSGLLLALHVARGPAPVVKPAVPASARAEATPGPRTLKAMAEQRVISLVLGPARPKLPQQLIDSRTGLVKNNVQAVCHHGVEPRSFICVVRLAGAVPGTGLYVRYRREHGGREILQWQGYRQG